MAKQVLTRIGIDTNSESLIKDSIFKSALENELKSKIIEILGAKDNDALGQDIKALNINIGENKNKPVGELIKGLRNQLSATHKDVLDTFFKKNDINANTTVKDLLGLDRKVADNPIFSAPLTKYNAERLGPIIKAKNLKIDVEKELPFFLASSADVKTQVLLQWKREKKWSDKEAKDFENATKLMRLTGNKADIVSALWNEGIQSTSDLVFQNKDGLLKLMKKNKIDSADASENAAYAEKVLAKVEQEYRSSVFLHRIAEKPEWLGLEKADRPVVSAAFKNFYSKNKEFDIAAEPVISSDTGLLNAKIRGVSNPTPEFVKELTSAQQALRLSSSTDMAALLFKSGVTTQKAMTTTHETLMREVGLSAAEAIEIKQKAKFLHETAMNGYFAYRDLVSNPFLKYPLENLTPLTSEILEGIGSTENWGEIQTLNGLKGVNSIEDLFGAQNYCECEACQSVLSPAAYFVDLMHFTEKRVLQRDIGNTTVKLLDETEPIHLKVRRPDLWKLPLTCENTNKRIPYIEIVNEVLVAFIEKQLGTTKNVSTRLIEHKPDTEFLLPYNQHLDELRTWLSYFGLQRTEILDYLYPNPTSAQRLVLAAERLNLSKEMYDIIVNNALIAVVDKDVLAFRRKSGLNSVETEQLTEMKFWQGKLSIIQVAEPGDIQKFKLEFSTPLTNWQGLMHRLIRLWKASSWSILELDEILDNLGITKDNLNPNAVLSLASFKQLEAQLNVDVSSSIGILKGIKAQKTEHSVLSWEQLLPLDWIANEVAVLDDLKANSDDAAVNLLLRLQGVFGINSSDILACLTLLQNKIGNVIGGLLQITFSTTSLNTIYRYIQIYKWSKLFSFEAFEQLLKVWGGGSIKYFDTPLADIPDFIRFVQSFQKAGVGTDDLVYIFDDAVDANVIITEDKAALESDDIRQFIVNEPYTTGDKYSTFFNKWLTIDSDILLYYKNFIEVSNTDLTNLFADLEAAAPSDATYIGLSNIKKRIERLSFLMTKYKVEVSNLKIIAQEAQVCVYPKFGFTTWFDKNWVKELACLGAWISETKALRNFDLFTILKGIEQENVFSDATKKGIAKWQKIDLTQVPISIQQTSSLKVIQSSWERITWAKKLNINPNLVANLKADNSINSLINQSTLLQNAIRSKFKSFEEWEVKIQDYKNKLSSHRRDALCNFVMFNGGIRVKGFEFETREDLYQYFLLDVGMGDCFTLPRIVVATNSLQTYINRCLMGLERSKDETINVSLDIDEMEEWNWRKNYRVWEANRKIYLFPENYIEPEIRDNKSPEFKELEDELLQQKLNAEVVENAYKKYLQQIMVLAELRIAGAYYDVAYNRVYLFGKTNKQPVEFYYRYAEFLKNGGIIWSNWEKMNIAIPAEDVSAIRHNGKLHIFWTTYQRKDISNVSQGTQEIKMHNYDIFANYSYLKVDKKWSAPQRIDLNYRTNSPFDAFLRLEKYKGMVDASLKPPKFIPSTYPNPDAADIRENVLKDFEKTIFRKPYPVSLSDQNYLKLNFIWTDKEDALQPVYVNTRAIIDAFTVSIALQIHVFFHNADIWSDNDNDYQFSFNRFDEIVSLPTTSNQSQPPSVINIPPRTITIWEAGNDSLKLQLSFSNSNGNIKFLLKTLTSSGNQFLRFKEDNKELKSGSVEILHQIDYKPVNSIEYEQNIIKMSEQKRISSSVSSITTAIRQEYDTYFDGFKEFFVTDGSSDFAEGNNDYKIQQRDLVAILTTPGNTDINQGYKLNPEHLQMLWDKISVGIDTLMDNQTQQHVAGQINYSQSFGNYFYELFFHIPMRIADHLNAAGKYREANHWYSYIYNPMAIKSRFEQLLSPNDVNWRFAAFRNLGIKKLQEIYSDPNAIEVYQRNPGNPHAIARLRIGAYQKNVVMKYLDNLMDWGDYLFEQYTPESTSEARNLYSLVKMILGNKPEMVGKCREEKIFTYNDIKDNSNTDFIYNLFTPVWQSPGVFSGYEVLANVSNVSATVASQLGNGSLQYSRLSQSTNAVSGIIPQTSVTATADRQLGMVEMTQNSTSNLMVDKMQARPQSAVSYFQLEIDMAFCFPHNKDFVKYWDRVNDRIFKLNNCLDINGVKKQMPAFAPEIDPALLASMVASGLSFDEITAALNSRLPYHRFSYLIEKAKQFCGTVQSFGGALFAAIEKRDAEELTLIRARHEQNILALTTQNKKRQIEQAKASYQNLLENKINIEKRKAHYEGLIEEGLIAWETAEQVAKWTSGGIRIAEGILQLLSGAFRLVPQLGSPFAMKYGGLELGDSANRFANALEATAKIADNVAILAGLEASHQRREQEWTFQAATATQELKGLEQQIRASEIALTMAEFDLELHATTIEQSKELYEFYTTKFSDYKHYTYQIQQLQKIYRMAFNLASDLAMQAQQAFEFERYGTEFNSGFIKMGNWNNEKVGLLAGEQLMLQLLQLEKEYMDTDKRKIEITQHFSMMQIAPDKLMELKINGECTGFSIPEAVFDLVYPGYFRRIIKSVRITIPCIAGPYTNIGATLTLGTNKIRDKADPDNAALKIFDFKGCETIATSNAQNDGGQFELNFRDERFLPFEGAGAISEWTLSLPNTLRPFDYDSISDVIFHISYTADYDGAFKTTTENNLNAALNLINGQGIVRAFSLRHDFPNEWHVWKGQNQALSIKLGKHHFPYFAQMGNLAISKVEAYENGTTTNPTVLTKTGNANTGWSVTGNLDNTKEDYFVVVHYTI